LATTAVASVIARGLGDALGALQRVLPLAPSDLPGILRVARADFPATHGLVPHVIIRPDGSGPQQPVHGIEVPPVVQARIHLGERHIGVGREHGQLLNDHGDALLNLARSTTACSS